MLDIHQGIPHGPNLAALFWGMCKVHAAVATHRLVDRCGVDMVVNADTCGRMEPGMDIFSTVIAARLFVTMSARLCRPTFILG